MINNMLFMPRPTKEAAARAGCGKTCNDLGLTDPTWINLMSPRRNRDKVREQIKDYVLLMLGGPVIDLELDQQQLDAAVDLSLQVIEDYAGREYLQWYTFNATPGQSVYELPPDVGYVRSLHYNETPHLAFASGDLGGVIPLEYMSGGAYGSIAGGVNPQQPIWGNMGDWTLFSQYASMYSRLSSQEGGWEWVGGFRHVKLYPTPFRSCFVSVHYIPKRPDFQEVTQSMQEGALAFAKIMIGRIRSKIKNPPGSVQLDGAEILAEGIQDKKDWEERLIYRFGDGGTLGPSWG